MTGAKDRRLGQGLGILLLTGGLVWNYWVIGWIFSPDGDIESAAVAKLIWLVDIGLILGGLFILRSPRYGALTLSVLIPSLTVFALSLALFGLLEAFPSLIRYMPFATLHYYAVTNQYIGDDELVLRNRPSTRFETAWFKGDEYRDRYGIAVEPLRYRVAYDGDGFRNQTASPDVDVVVLGDSYMEFGLDEDDTFNRRLESKSGLRTKNLATSYHGPIQYLVAFKRFGEGLKPRYALFCFFEGNDIDDIARYLAWKRGGAYGHYNLTSRNFIQRYAIVLSEAFVALSDMAERLWSSKDEWHSDDQDLVMLELGGASVPAVFSYKNEARPPEELLKTTEWNLLSELLTEFKALCVEHGIVPIVLFLPTKTHIYAQYSAIDSESGWSRIRSQQIAFRNNIEMTMRLVCRKAGIELVSLTPVFEQAAKEGRLLYYPFDSHWNSHARDIAASFIAASLPQPMRAKL